MPSQSTNTVDAKMLHYEYLKHSLELDREKAEEEVARRLIDQTVWFPPSAYLVLPLAVPYAVRDPECRRKRGQDGKDMWGRPNDHGYIRDDNSLIKGLVKSLQITSPKGSIGSKIYGQKKLGGGFVAAHIWSLDTRKRRTTHHQYTYSFWPNVVWLPRELALLTDYENSFVQPFIQTVSRKIYFNHSSPSKISDVKSYNLEKSWERLPAPQINDGITGRVNDLDVGSLNYFVVPSSFLKRRLGKIKILLEALDHYQEYKKLPEGKIITNKYAEYPEDKIKIENCGSTCNFLKSYAEYVENSLKSYNE